MTAIKFTEPRSSENSVPKSISNTGRRACPTVARLIVFLLCMVLFFWHGFYLIKFYLSFSTQIATNLSYAEVFDLPGVTICHKTDQTNSASGPTPADEVFKRYFNEREKETAEIKCNLMIPTLNQATGSVDSSPIACKDVAPVLESINYGMGQKCLTFFSRIGLRKRDQRNLQVRSPRGGLLTSRDGDLVRLEIDFGKSTLADDIEVSMAIHQGNELPSSWQKVSKLKPGNKYMTSFSKIIEKRLPSPYSTKCRMYGMKEDDDGMDSRNGSSNATPSMNNSKNRSVRSRYECVDVCLLELYRQKCNCLPTDISIRRQLLKPTDSFCTNPKCQNLRVYGQDVCENLPECKPECRREIYNFFTEVSDSGTSQVLHYYINSQGRGKIPLYSGRPMIQPGHLQTYGLHVSRW